VFHWEVLLVVAACDVEDVAFPFVTEGVVVDYLGNSFVLEEADSSLVVNVEELLSPCRGVSKIEPHIEIRMLLVRQGQRPLEMALR